MSRVTVQILAKVRGSVTRGLEIRSKCLILVVLDPGDGAAVVVVGEHLVVVDVEARQDGGS